MTPKPIAHLLRSTRSTASSPEPRTITDPSDSCSAFFHTLPSSKSQITPFAPKNVIEFKDFRCLIADCPTESTLDLYGEDFLRWKVTDVVRVCEPTYKKEVLEEAGIRVHVFIFI